MCPRICENGEAPAPAGTIASSANTNVRIGSGVRMRAMRCSSLVEADLHRVAILHTVLASFQPQPALVAGPCVAARLEQLLVGDHLGANEALRQIGVNLARRIDRRVTTLHRPRP